MSLSRFQLRGISLLLLFSLCKDKNTFFNFDDIRKKIIFSRDFCFKNQNEFIDPTLKIMIFCISL